MKIRDLYEDGRIVKGVNTTPDVDTNSISKETAKFGSKVDKDGRPPVINSKAAKNSTPNKLANLGLAESRFTPMEMAIMEGGHSLEDYVTESDLLVQQYSTNSLLKFLKKLSDLPVDMLLKKAIYKELKKRGVTTENLGEITRRGFVKGMGAAGVVAATGAKVDVAKAATSASGKFDPKTLQPGEKYWKVVISAPKYGQIVKYHRIDSFKDVQEVYKVYKDLIAKYDLGSHDLDAYRMTRGGKTNENFADGEKKGPSRPGRFKKAGVSCKGSVTSLRKKAKNASGERQKGYHWCANMKSGRKKG